MKKLNLYLVDKDYNNYIAMYNKHIFHLKDNGFRRPFVGVILSINNFDYFAPLTSPKKKHYKMKNSIDFFKVYDKERLISVLNINNMFPVMPKYLSKIDFKNIQDTNYKNLLIKELNFCRINEKRIKSNAYELYKGVVNNLFNRNLIKRCGNFKLLEEKCLEYEIYLKSIQKIAITTESDSNS